MSKSVMRRVLGQDGDTITDQFPLNGLNEALKLLPCDPVRGSSYSGKKIDSFPSLTPTVSTVTVAVS